MPRLWNSLPDDLRLRSVLVQGGAFRMSYEYGTEQGGPKRRYFFVANKAPVGCDEILVLTATREVEKWKNRRPPGTVVVLAPSTYSELKHCSLIDCNSPEPMRRDFLIRQIQAGNFQPLKPLPKGVLETVLAAVSKSALLSRADKRLILPE